MFPLISTGISQSTIRRVEAMGGRGKGGFYFNRDCTTFTYLLSMSLIQLSSSFSYFLFYFANVIFVTTVFFFLDTNLSFAFCLSEICSLLRISVFQYLFFIYIPVIPGAVFYFCSSPFVNVVIPIA